jgi:hypothetical protein
MRGRVDDEPSDSTEQKLKELKPLHEQGLITDTEYDEKRRVIIDRLGATPPPPPPPPLSTPAPTTSKSGTPGRWAPEEAALYRNENPKKKKSGGLGCLLIIAIIVIIIWAISALGSTTGGGSSSGGVITPSPTAAKREARVRYAITGTAKTVSITMENAQGNTEQFGEVSVPVQISLGVVPCGTFVCISAQNQGRSGSVSCEITHNSRPGEEATSVGEYVIASCSGSVEKP